ncbi:thioredoxin family protein [Flagellimonas sp. DF-77]|uniref:thioredoxin family protein n=1 Tax=Flagellimonas algarum TaxID=3230298 RepID=UPI0033985B9D
MEQSIFYHAGCPVCVEAENEILDLIGSQKVRVVDLSKDTEAIETAASYLVKSVPALVTPKGNVLHINFGASLDDLKK